MVIMCVAAAACGDGAGDGGALPDDSSRSDPNRLPEVVGGQPTTAGLLPSVASVTTTVGQATYQCGGSLVAPVWLLTAAHCTYNAKTLRPLPTSAFKIVAGLENLAITGGTELTAVEIVRHPSYVPGVPDAPYDVALIRLSGPSKQPAMQMADSSNAEDLAPGKETVVAGWGMTTGKRDGKASEVLLHTTVRIVGDAECATAIRPFVLDRKTMICAGGEKGIDACPGDSGGPLLILHARLPPTLAGVVSFGRATDEVVCGLEKVPGVYAEVANLRDFIDATLKKDGRSPSPPASLRATERDVRWKDTSDGEQFFEIAVKHNAVAGWVYIRAERNEQLAKFSLRQSRPDLVTVRACNNAGCSRWVPAVEGR
jgi:secreted trypsin-like serine protease